MKIIECVPNFSEGRNQKVIDQIVEVVRKVEGVKVLDVDSGETTNRTVLTFAGEPELVCEAAFQAVKMAAELIDMQKHSGEHPRFGATDVLPLVPVSGISMEETVEYARKLAKRIGEELEIPVYCYENAAFEAQRKNLANCREGEYEALPSRLISKDWKPDFGPATFTDKVRRTGATAVSARDFLIAYNVNLNTTSTRWANGIAFDIREKGRLLRDGDPYVGRIVTDDKGEQVYSPGLLKGVKGIGWYLEEYGIAQLSFNITNTSEVSMHQVFDLSCERAAVRGIRVTGSEIVGVVPLKFMLDAGKYYLEKQHRSIGIADAEIIKIAVKSLGLDDLKPFDPNKKIIEYLLKDENPNLLIHKTLKDFVIETASESAAPGGGSIAATLGALGAALASMVANLSAHKRGWEDRWDEFSGWAEKGKYYWSALLDLIDKDTEAFNAIMDAFSLPKVSPEEKAVRSAAIQKATTHACEIPFQVMQLSFDCMELLIEMAQEGNPNSVTDAGVGALAARSAVLGAGLNVRINAKSLKDKAYVEELLFRVQTLEEKAKYTETSILEIVNRKI